ncbi:AraC family transcriptional regulator [Comamonas testosteroni]|uniref:AraC family transcriptional regulator n=1 Tax=Comamonas testosteroni TaxID=285 RepID=UPI00389AA8F0
MHQHQEGQLIVALKGAVTCEVPEAMWVVPPLCGVWVPSETPHSIRATANAEMCHLFVEPSASKLPSRCCTLALSALVRELILDIASRDSKYETNSSTGRKSDLLLEELATMPIEQLYLPTSQEPRIQTMARKLIDDPADRRTLDDWGKYLAMSERSLARLVLKETGLTFGRWRQQLHLIVAMRQLASGSSVQQTANDLGYDSVNAFIAMFKKVVGKPPARYFADLTAAP